MFSDRTIELSDLVRRANIGGVELVRDCALSHVAKVPSRVARRLVPCGKPIHLAGALAADEIVGVIVPEAMAPDVPEAFGLVVADRPSAVANLLHGALCEISGFHWDSFDSIIDPTARVHPTAHVAAQDVVIGANSIIHPGAIVLPRSIIGAHCAIGPGAVVGTDAFEVDITSSPHRILPQAGGVLMEDHVEVQAKCTIVRATFGGFTTIGREAKLDCQVHLAHDCVIGERVRVAACAEISGRVTVGDAAFIGPNCSISNGIDIGAGAHVTLGAVVVRDVADGARVSGNFAIDHGQLIKHIKEIR